MSDKKQTQAPKGPSESTLKSAFAAWMRGGISVWGIKKQTKIRASVLMPAFEKLLGKKIKSPSVRMPVKGKSAKEGVRRAA